MVEKGLWRIAGVLCLALLMTAFGPTAWAQEAPAEEPAAEEEPCYFDRAKMKEVILNIGINSLQALDGKGMLRLTSFQTHGRQWIQVTDNGPGITAENLDHIFKPFFTSKREGTGLGLSLVYGIVENQGGRIWAHSEPDKGATFIIELPILPNTDEGKEGE